MDQTQVGPRLSDADFFSKIDTTRPGLEGIPAAVARGDYAAARRQFAAEARAALQPQRFLTIDRPWRGANFMRDGETAEEAGERILRGELISCATPHQFEGEVDWFANPTFNKYAEWTWQLSRHPEWALLGERYRATGDERFAAAFVRYFKSWVRQAVVPENAGGWDTLCWRTIETGIRMGGAWQWALHSFYKSPHFTDDVLVDWYKSVWEHGWRLRNFHRTGNWLIMEMNGLAQVAVIYPQLKDSPAWLAYAFDKLTAELDAQIYPDGWQIELSTGYHQVDINNYQWLMDVCQALGVATPPQFRTAMEKMHAVNVLMMMPDGRLPDVNDGGWHDVARLMKSAVKDFPARSDFLWAFSKGKEGKPPAGTSHAFDYAGYYIMRSGWQKDALWALFDGGPFGYGHQHEDKLSVLFHAYGRLLLTEGGNYAYDISEMRRYVLSTRAHNTIRVDGHDQNRRIAYDRDAFDVTMPAGAAWRSSAERDVAGAVYDEGYGPAADRTVTHQRTAILLKRGIQALGPCLIIVDRLTPADNKPHRYQWLWHMNTETAETDGLVARSNDGGLPNLAIIPATRAGLSAAIVCGQETPEFQGWKAIKNHQQGEYMPTPTAVYELEASGPLRMVTVLYPTHIHETNPIAAVEAGTGADDQDMRVMMTDGRAVTLDEETLVGR